MTDQPILGSEPSVPGVYDCLLGGRDHTVADQEFVRDLARSVPRVQEMAHANRRFLQRAVRHARTSGGDSP